MFSRKTVWIVIALLLAEAAAIVAIPSRIPRAMRAVTALVNVVAASALWLLLRQRSRR
jgi:hypothetical protein